MTLSAEPFALRGTRQPPSSPAEAFSPRAYLPRARDLAFEAREPGSAAERDEGLVLAVAVSCLPGLRAAERLTLFRALDGLEPFSVLSTGNIEEIVGRRFKTARPEALPALKEAERAAAFLQSREIRAVCFDDPAYPPQLREIADPPFLLYVRGRLPDPERACVAIVGTRDPDARAWTAARELARGLAARGVPVVSGLALGIDRAAHEGALDREGETVAVLGCGIDAVYPPSHQRLAARILVAGGAIVSEYPPGREALRYHFPERNRIVSGLCRSVVVAQAPLKSGALITADFALEQGRDLLVLEAGLGGERGRGGAELAESGARIVRSARDIAYEWIGYEDWHQEEG
jgi:DNA processing protein